MLNVPYEEFLADLCCRYLDDVKTNDSKYHYICSNPEQAVKLYNGFKKLGFSTLIVKDVILNYVTTSNGQNVIVMLHNIGEVTLNTYHEDFIASIRDELNNISNAILLVIHNSSLETILTTCKNLSLDNRVYTPEFVERTLVKRSQSHPYINVINALIERRTKILKDQKRSIFAYKSIYKAIIGSTISYQDELLFDDSRLMDNDNLRQIKGEIEKNSTLYQSINNKVKDAGDNKSYLKETLEEIGLGEKFIKDNFLGRDEECWRSIDYRTYEAEIDLNKIRKLDLSEININGVKLETWKRASMTGAKRKVITVIIEVDPGNIDLRFKMKQGDPLLKMEQVKLSGDYMPHQFDMNISNHEKHAVLKAIFSFNGEPKFFQIRLKRVSGNENIQFNCAIVERVQFNIKNYFEKVSVEFNRSKGKLLLENISDSIDVNTNINNVLDIQYDDEIIDFENYGKINFKDRLETEVCGEFKFKFKNNYLPVTVTGPITLDSIKLPSILDPLRSSNIFEKERNSKFNSITKRAIVAGKEKELSVDAKKLCTIESRYISEKVLYLNDDVISYIAMSDLRLSFKELISNYQELYGWLEQNETIISLTNWPDELCSIVTRLLNSFYLELEAINDGSLSKESRELLKIGVYYKDEKEWFTPLHPLCLAYSLQLANTLSGYTDGSLADIPKATLDKLNPEGLIPILFDDKYGYAYSSAHPHNKLWIEIVPQKQSNNKFVTKLVLEKIIDFTSCFDMLFKQNKDAPLLLNSINNQNNDQIFKGIVSYYKKFKQKAKKIHINIYDDLLFKTSFDVFSESNDIEEIRKLVKVIGNEKPVVTDELILLVRKNVTYSKFHSSNSYNYCHLSFFKNNEKVSLKEANVLSAKTGIACQGLISGEASYLENGNYYTGFGEENLQESNLLIKIASSYNQLLKVSRDTTARYIKGVVPVLSVQDNFRDKLAGSYTSSIWTCIIEPKVTLDFFDQKETILIHYSDQYTNSISYDAITVSSRIGLYKGLLKNDSDELISSFNAISGQWLLDIVKESGRPKTTNTEKQIKEKNGIVSAYKFVSALLLNSDITWIPLSVGEMLRVTGSVGLEIKENDFSARLHNKRKGALCDDILFVGFKDNSMYLLPLEVKSREKGNDFVKAVAQAKELYEHMTKLLAASTFKGQLFRSLFIQQVMSQLEKYELYNVFPKEYFSKLKACKEILQQGNYKIKSLNNYPKGIALAINNNIESAKIDCKPDNLNNEILTIRLPDGLISALQKQPIELLNEKLIDHSIYPELEPYILSDCNSSEVIFKENISINATNKNIFRPKIVPPVANFDYPLEYSSIVGKLLNSLGRNISSEEIFALSERKLIDFGCSTFTEEDMHSFFRLKEYLSLKTEEVSTPTIMSKLKIPLEFLGLVNLLNRHVGNDLTKEHLISLTDKELLSIEGFGVGKLLQFKNLINYIEEETVISNSQEKFISSELGSIKLSNINIKQEYISLINAIKRNFGDDISVGEVLLITDIELLDINGFGKGKITKFNEFTNLLKNNAFSINIPNEAIDIIRDFELPIFKLEEYLINSLDSYLDIEKERQVEIFTRRLGIGCEIDTLEDIGHSFNVSRERIRQIETQCKKNFIAQLLVDQNVIRVITKSNLSELREPLFPKLRGRFNKAKGFYSFLEICCGFNENEIKRITAPSLNKSVLNEYWINHRSPTEVESLSWYLHENLNVELAIAENQIVIWKQEGILELIDNKVKPLTLPKVEALTNALLDMPSGDTWESIQKHAITKNITNSEITLLRLEASLMTAADREHIYQSARGKYRHINYLELDHSTVKAILSRVKTKLIALKYDGRHTASLAIDIFEHESFAEDYYVVRHIVRSFGASEGIFFKGKSGADTVSLDSEFDLASQKTVLVEIFKSSLKALTKNDIASKIRSQSIGHASFYLDKLVTEGLVVRVDETHFAHVDNAFSGVDIATVVNTSIKFIDKEERVIEGEKIQTFLNRSLDLEYNKYFYLSLLKVYTNDYYFVQNLLSKNPLKASGLVDYCREALANTSNNTDAIEYVKKHVCAHDHVIRRTLYQSSLSSNEKSLCDSIGIKNQVVGYDQLSLLKEDNLSHEVDIKSGNDINFKVNEEKPATLENMRILIGKSIGTMEDIYWEYGNKELANRHLIVFGRSGQGKTYCIQGLLLEMAKLKINSMVVDYTNGFLPEHLEPEFTEFVKPQTDLVAYQALDLNPFKKQVQKVAGIQLIDKPHDVAARVASVFKSIYTTIGDQQLPTLIRTIEEGIRLYEHDYNFERLLNDLLESGKHGEALANKLSPMVKSNLFSCKDITNGWQGVYKISPATTRLIQLATLSRDIWRIATEFILWDLYSYACINGNKNLPLPVILDEVQNLDHKLDSPLGKMLTEGRKYGLSLILATQTLSNLDKDEQDRLFQAAHKLFFAPAETEIKSYANLLEQAVPGTNKKAWLQELAKLKKGECISVGLHLNDFGEVVQGAKVVRITSLDERVK